MGNVVFWRRPLLLVALLLVPLPALAQAPGAMHVMAVDAARPEHLEFLVDLPEGTTAGDPAEFQLLEDGRETGRASGLQPFRDSGWGLATVLAVDTSGSVRRYISAMGTVLPEFVAQHPPGDAFALVTFDDAVQPDAPFGTPREEVHAGLRALRASGSRTLLYSALHRSIESFMAAPGARTWRRIVVISDGADESSDQPNAIDDIITEALAAGIAIDTVWVGQPVASTRNTLVRLAERTGGIHNDASDPANVENDLRAALARTTARADESVVVAFDRQVEPGTLTQQIGVRLARAGITPALVSMQVARSAPPPTSGDAGQPWWLRMLTTVLLSLVVLYFLYAAAYVAVLKKSPDRIVLFPFVPWPAPRPEPLPSPPATSVVPPPPPAPRYTRVGDPAPLVTAGGTPPALLLEGFDGPLRGQRISIDRARFQIGAAKANDLQIPADKYLSSVHAVIQTSRAGWIVLDQESSNGTYVDGRRVGSGGHELRDGQMLRLGASEFKVGLGAGATVEASASEVPPR